MTDLHTRRTLLDNLASSTTKSPIEKQRLSFVMGSLPNTSTLTREQVHKVLNEHPDSRKRA